VREKQRAGQRHHRNLAWQRDRFLHGDGATYLA
jgi:hypothetical protein